MAGGILALAAFGLVVEVAGVRRPVPPHVTGAVPVAKPPAEVKSPPPVRPLPTPTPQPLVVRRVLDTGGPIAFGKHFWDETGAPATGPLVITVDVAAQTLSVFRDGWEIGTAAILYGADEKPTPLGTFPIRWKRAKHTSSLYGAPMPYTLNLTGDGVAVHGTEVAWGYATHGCIGVPVAFARKLFAVTRPGDRVIITRGRLIGMGQPIA